MSITSSNHKGVKFQFAANPQVQGAFVEILYCFVQFIIKRLIIIFFRRAEPRRAISYPFSVGGNKTALNRNIFYSIKNISTANYELPGRGHIKFVNGLLVAGIIVRCNAVNARIVWVSALKELFH